MQAILRLFLIWALAFWAVLAFAKSGLSEADDSLLIGRFLQTQNLIRLGFETGPGLGHQTTAVSVARGLRRLGYTGWIEIIYSSSPKPKAENDLALLFPDFVPGAGEFQEITASRLRFVSNRHFKAESEKFPEIDLGILGADDHDRKPADMRVRSLLTLQPMAWHTRSKIGILYPIDEPVIWLDQISHMGFISETNSLDDLSEGHFSKEGIGNSRDFTTKIHHLRKILEASPTVDLAPYYGHGYYASTTQLETYLRAIRRGQVKYPESFKNGVVVPIFLESPWFDRQTTSDIQKNPELSPTTKTIAIDDPSFAEGLNQLRTGNILVIYAGRVPRDIFELFFAKAAIAPVVGGRNSLNFMRQIGRPYLTSSPLVRFPFLKDISSQQPEFIAAVAERAMLSDRPVSSNDIELMSQFIIEARNPVSDVYNTFVANRLPTGLSEDKLAQGLLELLKHRSQIGLSAKHTLAIKATRSSKNALNAFAESCGRLLRGS